MGKKIWFSQDPKKVDAFSNFQSDLDDTRVILLLEFVYCYIVFFPFPSHSIFSRLFSRLFQSCMKTRSNSSTTRLTKPCQEMKSWAISWTSPRRCIKSTKMFYKKIWNMRLDDSAPSGKNSLHIWHCFMIFVFFCRFRPKRQTVAANQGRVKVGGAGGSASIRVLYAQAPPPFSVLSNFLKPGGHGPLAPPLHTPLLQINVIFLGFPPISSHRNGVKTSFFNTKYDLWWLNFFRQKFPWPKLTHGERLFLLHCPRASNANGLKFSLKSWLNECECYAVKIDVP